MDIIYILYISLRTTKNKTPLTEKYTLSRTNNILIRGATLIHENVRLHGY